MPGRAWLKVIRATDAGKMYIIRLMAKLKYLLVRTCMRLFYIAKLFLFSFLFLSFIYIYTCLQFINYGHLK